MLYSVLSGHYHLLKTIGNGGFGKVKQAIHLLTGEYVAIKIIDKAKLGNDVVRIGLEIKAMKDLKHQHICRLYQVIETDEHFFLILEYLSNGELFDYIVNRNRLSEQQARHFFRQIVSAVAYMHNRGYCHRDLKPENLLLDRRENLKLIDFGLCAEPKEGIHMTYLGTACGSPAYAAPELIAGTNYRGDSADIWSLGVLLYALLCGMLPFDDDNIASMYTKIQNGNFPLPPWLSADSICLLRQMLQVDPKKRIRIDRLTSHPWLLNNEYPAPVEWQSIYQDGLDLSCVREIANYYGQTIEEIITELSLNRYDYTTATYHILLDLKSRNKSFQLTNHGSSIPIERPMPVSSRLIQLQNQETKHRSCPSNRYSLPTSNLLALSQQMTKEIPSINEASQPAHRENNPMLSFEVENNSNDVSETSSHCQGYLMLPHLSNEIRYVQEKGADHRLTGSKSYNDALDGDNLNELNIAPSLKSFSLGAVDLDDLDVFLTPQRQKKNVRSLFDSVERSINTFKQILTPKRIIASKPRKISETANVTPFNFDDFNRLCICLEQAIQMNSQLKYRQKRNRFLYNVFIEDDWGKIVLEFDLDIVMIQGKRLGIQRQRTKGNVWHYKRCCEDIIKQITRIVSEISVAT